MKICVLFGSFNPLTNAHVTALRSAVDAIGADKGLFVATNGQYLKRKTVKIDDPFYLSEDERKTIIEKTCTTEPDLEFWGFELGGINPSRFKTLCKIQKQYPDAELYERLIELGAPEIVVTEEGRCLAEEMVLYYYGKEEPIIWD